MSVSAGSIEIILEATTASFERSLATAQSSIEQLESGLEGLAEVSVAAFAALAAGAGLALSKYAEVEESQTRLAASARAAGAAFNAQQFDAVAESLERLANVDKTATNSAGALLMSFRLNQQQVEALLPRLADLHALTGIDLPAAAQLLGRSIESGTNALQRQGIAMSAAQEEIFKTAAPSERLAMLMDLLQQKAGGVAEAMAGTTTGAFRGLALSVDNLFESIGKLEAGPIAGLIRDLTKVVDEITGLITGFKNTKTAGEAVHDLITRLVNAATSLTSVFGIMVAPAIIGIGLLHGALDGLKASFDEMIDGFMEKWSGFATALAKGVVFAGALLRGKGLEGAESAAGAVTKENSGGLLNAAFNPLAGAADKAGGALGFLGDALAQGRKDIADLMSSFVDLNSLVKHEKRTRTTEGGGPGLDAPVVAAKEAFSSQFMAGVRSAVDKVALDMQVMPERSKWLRQTLDVAFSEAQVQLLDASSSLVKNVATGELTAAGEIYNALDSAFGPTFAGAIAVTGFNAVKSIGSALGDLAADFLSNIKGVGEVWKAAHTAVENVLHAAEASGAQATTGSLLKAGVAGGAEALAIELVQRTKSFAKIQDIVGKALGDMSKALEPLINSLIPLVRAVLGISKVILGSLTPVFSQLGGILQAVGDTVEALVPILELLKPVFDLVGFVMSFVTSGIAAVLYGVVFVIKGLLTVWNGMLGIIQSIFSKLGSIEIFGKHPLGFLNGWADSLQKAKVNTDQMSAALKDLGGMVVHGAAGRAVQDVTTDEPGGLTDAAGSAADHIDKMGNAAAKATESLTNVPTGFKIEAARFAATSAISGADMGAASQTSPIQIQSMQVIADDPRKFREALAAEASYANFVKTGQPLANVGTPYMKKR